MSGNPELARVKDIVLAEFAGLRGEIATRTGLLITLMLGNLTVLGVVLGIALSHRDNTNVLLLLPLVTPCIGLLVIDTFRNLDNLGRYISLVIRPQLQISESLPRFEGMKVFDWERWAAQRQLTLWFAAPFQFVLWAEFFGPPIAVLIYATNHHLVNTLQFSVWWAGAVLTGVLFFYTIIYLIYSMRHPLGSKMIRTNRSGQ